MRLHSDTEDVEPQIPQMSNYESNLISLENLNPLDPRKRLTSPRSIKVCMKNNININDLFHTSYMEIAKTSNKYQRQNSEYIKCKYIYKETQRSKLISYLKKERNYLIEQRTNHYNNGWAKSFEQRNKRKGYKQSLNISAREDDYIIQKMYERGKIEYETTKEINILMKRANINADINQLYRDQYFKRLKRPSTSLDTYNYSDYKIAERNNSFNRYKILQYNLGRQRRIYNANFYEQHKEMEETAKLANEHKRQIGRAHV